MRPYNGDKEKTEERMEKVRKIIEISYPKWDWKKFKKGMTIHNACDEVWIAYTTLKYWRDNYPEIELLFSTVNKLRMNIIEDIAKENVYEALSWNTKLRPDKKVDVSLRFLEKVSDDFNPIQKVSLNWNSKISFDTPIEELQERALELAAQLKSNETPNE